MPLSPIQRGLPAFRGILLAGPWLAQLFVADALLSLLLPLSFFFPTLVYNLSSGIAGSVWWGIQTIFTTCNGASISTSGDELPQYESAIVVANHVSWTDFYMIQHLAIKSGMLGRCRWFAKESLKYVPFLGWGLWAMGMPLVSRRWDSDQKVLERVFFGPKRLRWPMWLISYSEGTRFTTQKLAETREWCKAHDKPMLSHTLFPRTKGFASTVKELGKGSSIKAVYDLTIAYAHGHKFMAPPSMWTTISQGGLSQQWRFHVHAKRYDIEELAALDDAELGKWLEDRWVAKDAALRDLKSALEHQQSWSGIQRQ